MDELIKTVRTYKLTTSLDQRLMLAEEIFREIEPKLRIFVFGSVARSNAPDILQEALKAIALGLGKFNGTTKEAFWAWCYQIARYKLADHFRREGSDRMRVVPIDELHRMIDSAHQFATVSLGEQADLEYAMRLLSESKPECRDLLWSHYILDLDYSEIAEDSGIAYDTVRMQISRCLTYARGLVT